VSDDSPAKPKSAFKLKKASVGGTTVSKLTPARWQQFEEQHVCNRVLAQKSKLLKTVNPLI
jgi:hypothetical protein